MLNTISTCGDLMARIEREENVEEAKVATERFFKVLAFRPIGEPVAWGEVAKIFAHLNVLGKATAEVALELAKQRLDSTHQTQLDEHGNVHHAVDLTELVRVRDQV